MSELLEDWEVTVLLSHESRFSHPASPLLNSLLADDYGRSDPVYLRALARDMHDLPGRRREWLLEFADRIEDAGYRSFAEVPAERFDEIAQLY
jgi:hypothetical protein